MLQQIKPYIITNAPQCLELAMNGRFLNSLAVKDLNKSHI